MFSKETWIRKKDEFKCYEAPFPVGALQFCNTVICVAWRPIFDACVYVSCIFIINFTYLCTLLTHSQNILLNMRITTGLWSEYLKKKLSINIRFLSVDDLTINILHSNNPHHTPPFISVCQTLIIFLFKNHLKWWIRDKQSQVGTNTRTCLHPDSCFRMQITAAVFFNPSPLPIPFGTQETL